MTNVAILILTAVCLIVFAYAVIRLTIIIYGPVEYQRGKSESDSEKKLLQAKVDVMERLLENNTVVPRGMELRSVSAKNLALLLQGSSKQE